MKRIFSKFKEKIALKERPPPYNSERNDDQQLDNTNGDGTCEVIDLLANCNLSRIDEPESSVEYAEIDMGLWHSTPLAHRHKSKISLTWVLKENLENAKITTEKYQSQDKFKSTIVSDKCNQVKDCIDVERYRKCETKSRNVRDRVVGRNEYYHHLRFRNACEEFANIHDTYSDTSVGTEEYIRRKHRHRHKRKKKRPSSGKFGYDIKDLDSFLTEASIDRPGNIPVVIAYPTTLYQTHKAPQQELSLPLGTVVNAVFKNKQWLHLSSILRASDSTLNRRSRLPFEGIWQSTTPQKKTPCWESSTDIYPRPCGNLTDTEKEQMRGRTRSDCRYTRKPKNCAEKDFDTLYLKTKSVCSINKIHDKENFRETKVKRQTLLVVNSDYIGSVLNKTLSVRKGEVVVLEQGGGVEADVDAEWFYVRKKNGSLGFIPAAVAGHGYI